MPRAERSWPSPQTPFPGLLLKGVQPGAPCRVPGGGGEEGAVHMKSFLRGRLSILRFTVFSRSTPWTSHVGAWKQSPRGQGVSTVAVGIPGTVGLRAEDGTARGQILPGWGSATGPLQPASPWESCGSRATRPNGKETLRPKAGRGGRPERLFGWWKIEVHNKENRGSWGTTWPLAPPIHITSHSPASPLPQGDARTPGF